MFLRDMCQTLGHIEEAEVFYHIKTKKHQGIGRVGELHIC